ncbi:MAG: PQQ-binding-like beta-propeller repeat protein [Candidatus Brocadiia bacterium]
MVWLAFTVAASRAAAGAAPAPDPEFAARAQKVLDLTGVTGGLVVHVGCGEGRLTAALRANDRLLVQGLDADPAQVRAAREHIHSLGLYGPVSVATFDGKRLPYVGNLVDVIVAGDGATVARDELLRALAPGGVACLGEPGGWHTVEKPWPEGMDEWTHWLHGPDGNAVSRDRRVGISRHLQWAAGPRWSRHHNLLPSVSAMVTAGGRLFTIMDEGPIAVKGVPDRWFLVARDAFNGLELWKRGVRNWGWREWSNVEFAGLMRFKGPLQLERRLVAVGDVVYVTLGFEEPVVALDAATGETLRRYEGTEKASEILCHRGRLLLARNVLGDRPGKDILAVDAGTGDVLWERKGYRGVTAHNDELSRYTDAFLAAGEERLFFLDRDHVVALDLASGREAWRTPRPQVEKGVIGHYKYYHADLCSLTYADGRLFLGQMFPFPENLNKRQQKEMVVRAMDAASGETLWEGRGMTLAHFTPPDLFVARGMVWTLRMKDVSLLGLDAATGEVRREYPAKSILVGHHARCYRNKATERYYLAGEEGIEYIDLASGEVDIHHWVRGACRYGILPANGLIYLPTHSCGCHHNVKLNGFLALAAQRGPVTKGEGPEAPERWLRGPAFDRPTTAIDTSADWPTYKHDPRRSNCATTELPAELSPRWKQELGGRLTAPVVAGGRVFLASQDSHQVYALDARTGEAAWRFTADGPVDTPPTWHKGRVLFGSRAGSVYALAAEDGALAGRFRAAPASARLVALGRLESPWPVHGSVLVSDDKVYCVAGRSMHLDGGLYAYVLDAATGRPLQHARLQAQVGPKGELQGAVLPDILVSDGQHLYMRWMRFEPDDIRQHKVSRGGAYLLANDGGLLDDTWFPSTFWRYGAAAGQILVFDGDEAYGVCAYKKFVTKSYPHDIFTAGKDGYRLFATPADEGRTEGRARRRRAARPADRWAVRIPIRVQGMVLTPRCLVVAGSPDVVPEDDPWAALEGRAGGVLAVFSREDGEKLAELELGSPPVYDGLAAARSRLYVSTTAGSVLCLGGEQ